MFLPNLAYTQRLAAERANFIDVVIPSRIKTEIHTHFMKMLLQDAWEYPLWNKNPSPLSVSDSHWADAGAAPFHWEPIYSSPTRKLAPPPFFLLSRGKYLDLYEKFHFLHSSPDSFLQAWKQTHDSGYQIWASNSSVIHYKHNVRISFFSI